MKIKEVMNSTVETIEPDATLRVAAQKMKELDVGSLPVCEGDKIIGMVTDRDIVVRSTADGAEPNRAHVREVMTPEVVCCTPEQDVKAAAQLMEEKKVRRIPVVDGQQHPVGILSLGDVAARSHNTRLAGEVLSQVAAHPRIQAKGRH
ncbi:MAG TPA: CBS domain-containing protein [Candidatus Acidoferrales bacterium]|jgi:CBS domain-containing protein|nr:CBS domain-containing protein [Candidatus Acidoferrales bacterium]